MRSLPSTTVGLVTLAIVGTGSLSTIVVADVAATAGTGQYEAFEVAAAAQPG